MGRPGGKLQPPCLSSLPPVHHLFSWPAHDHSIGMCCHIQCWIQHPQDENRLWAPKASPSSKSKILEMRGEGPHSSITQRTPIVTGSSQNRGASSTQSLQWRHEEFAVAFLLVSPLWDGALTSHFTRPSAEAMPGWPSLEPPHSGVTLATEINSPGWALKTHDAYLRKRLLHALTLEWEPQELEWKTLTVSFNKSASFCTGELFGPSGIFPGAGGAAGREKPPHIGVWRCRENTVKVMTTEEVAYPLRRYHKDTLLSFCKHS